MMQYNENEFIWEQKYRPKTIDDIILPKTIKSYFKQLIDLKECKNILLSGPPGYGKTSLAYILANELGADLKYVNASLDTSVDILRNDVFSFATSYSMYGGNRIVLLDEIERFSGNALDALRGIIENVSSNCRFIATTNYIHKLPQPIISRFDVIDFKVDKSEKPELMLQTYKRVVKILNNENVEFDKEALLQLVKIHYPNLRKLLIELQKYSLRGKIDESCLNLKKTEIGELVEFIKDKDFSNCKKWSETNFDYDDNFFRQFYDVIYNQLKPESIPGLILSIADAQYKCNFGGDKGIYLDELCVKLMLEATFK